MRYKQIKVALLTNKEVIIPIVDTNTEEIINKAEFLAEKENLKEADLNIIGYYSTKDYKFRYCKVFVKKIIIPEQMKLKINIKKVKEAIIKNSTEQMIKEVFKS